MKRVGHFLAAFVTAVLTGGGVGIVLLLAYVVGKLYLSGHGIEPPWYDTAGSAVVFGGALLVAAITFRVMWKAARSAAQRLPDERLPP